MAAEKWKAVDACHLLAMRAVSAGRVSLHLGLQPSAWLAEFRFHISASWARQPHAPSELGVILTAEGAEGAAGLQTKCSPLNVLFDSL